MVLKGLLGSPMAVFLDCNNFWSPSGGGVRRYHSAKMEFFRNQKEHLLVFAMPSENRWTEGVSAGLIIEHIPALKMPGNWEYRFSFSLRYILPLLKKYKPDAIEIGSPYFLPFLFRFSKRARKHAGRFFGFWHADFPVTYVKRFFMDSFLFRIHPKIADWAENLAWWYARKGYEWMDGVFVSSEVVGRRMQKAGMNHLHHVPLGVDLQTFNPGQRDLQLVDQLKGGNQERLTIFFPHRHAEEKGLRTLLAAYPILVEALGHEPALVFAGTGPDLPMVRKAAGQFPHIQYLGFLNSPQEMARYYASTDVGLAMSGWETFGLSIMESLACGQLLVGANTGAAAEHIQNSGAGVSLSPGDPKALADAICSLYNSEKKELMRQQAQQYASRYTWDACFHREIAIYRTQNLTTEVSWSNT